MIRHGAIRVLVDTDPGLDDAVAILFALADPQIAVEAITAVAGNIGLETTTRNVGGLLAAMGRGDVPYASGASEPLAGVGRSEIAIHGLDGLGGVVLPGAEAPPDRRGATDLLAATLRAAPAETFRVLALGPLTNLALLLREAPEAYARIEQIIAMGGTLDEPGNAGPFAEFNLAADPVAAREVLSGPVPVTLVPLDITRKVRASPEDLDRLAGFETPAATLSARLVRAYFADHSDRTSRPLHDPCVMLMAVAPDLFDIEHLELSVDCDGHAGRLRRVSDGPRISVALRVNAGAALERLWQGLGRIA